MAEAAQKLDGARQLRLYDSAKSNVPKTRSQALTRPSPAGSRLCATCRAAEARYGFRPEGADDPTADRPRTLCFECFRVEIMRRQGVAARMSRGWNGQQQLPLEERMRTLALRRRRAQIAARKALDL